MAKTYFNEEHELDTDPLLLPNDDTQKIPHMVPPPAYGDDVDDTFFVAASAPPSELAPSASHTDTIGTANDGDDESSLHISSSNDDSSPDSDSNSTPGSRARRSHKRDKKRKAPKPIQHSHVAGIHLEMCDHCCHLDFGLCGCALWMCDGCMDFRCWAMDWFHNISGMDERGTIQGGKRRINSKDKGKGRANGLRL